MNQYPDNTEAELADCAAAYGFGLVKNHAFSDGNKRIAFIATALFLRRNGLRLNSTAVDEIQTMFRVASGGVSEADFAVWLRAHTQRAL